MGPALQPGQRSEHHGDLVRGSFQPVEGRDAAGSERITIGLTAKRLDALGMPMFAIADEGMDMNIGDPVVGALLVRTGESLGVHPFGCAPAAFHLTPQTHRSRRWPST